MFVLSAEGGVFLLCARGRFVLQHHHCLNSLLRGYGQPIRHYSPAMHNLALAELGLDWRYLACEVAPDELGQAIAGAKAMGFIGLLI